MRNITKQVFTITDMTSGQSRNDDGIMWTIELQNIMTGETFKTYVSEGHKNFKNWERMVENTDRHYLISNMKLKEIKKGPNAGNHYINGDSRIDIQLETADYDYFETLIYQMRGELLPVHLRGLFE